MTWPNESTLIRGPTFPSTGIPFSISGKSAVRSLQVVCVPSSLSILEEPPEFDLGLPNFFLSSVPSHSVRNLSADSYVSLSEGLLSDAHSQMFKLSLRSSPVLVSNIRSTLDAPF
ncbi:hypothetical protein D1872_209610 [compost metagenome]